MGKLCSPNVGSLKHGEAVYMGIQGEKSVEVTETLNPKP